MADHTDSRSKSRIRLAAAGLAVLALGLPAAAPARADPLYPSPPSGQNITLHVNTTTGAMSFTGDPGSNMSYYQIISPSNSLNDAQWLSFQDQSILNPTGAITTALPGQIIDWMEMEHNNGIFQDMACANMMPGMNGLPVIFDTAQRTYGIGNAFQVGSQQDLQFIFTTDLNYTPDYLGTVVYSTVPEPASLAMLCGGGLVLWRRRRRVYRFRKCS